MGIILHCVACVTAWLVLWPPDAADDAVQPAEHLIAFPHGLLPLDLGDLELLLQLADQTLLVLLRVLEAWKAADEVFDLLLLVHEITGQLFLAQLELVCGKRLDCAA